MELKILCTPEFSDTEEAALKEIAANMHTTLEEVVRHAVRLFCESCVPTQTKPSVSPTL